MELKEISREGVLAEIIAERDTMLQRVVTENVNLAAAKAKLEEENKGLKKEVEDLEALLKKPERIAE